MLPTPEGIVTLVIYVLAVHHTPTQAAPKGVWRRVEAVSGMEAVLPCEVGSFEPSDMVYVVLWYRNVNKEPIYSYDNRPGRLQPPDERHTVKSELLRGRVTFRPGQVPALHINPVTKSDQANYTCRVDFRIESSRRTYLALHVVVPPSSPLLKVGGLPVTDGVVGPLQEGSPLDITCSVAGGDPAPDVVWVREGQTLDSTIESRTASITINQLRILKLDRSYHNSHLLCVTSNNNVTDPLEATITVTMNLRPLVTKLDAPPKGLRVGREYEIRCATAGSRPHPNITWTLGNVASLTPLVAITQHGVNISTSLLKVTASRTHHGQRLTCSSHNPLFPAFPLTDSTLLNVTYPPVARTELGRGVSSVVREGEDVYFNCLVDSNPPTYKISWFREDKPILHSPEGGVLLSANSLALRGVTRHQAGPYICSASNVEGDAHSPPLNLSVNYSPVCRDVEEGSTTRVYATGLGQFVNVTCRVLASPPSVRYSWVFNNSITSQRLPGDQVFDTPDGASVVQFVARTHQDYGTLQCWAQNTVGRMTEPCLFHVVPAGRPEHPVGCAVVNKTYDSLAVGCQPGFDGGLQQTFVAKVFEAVTGEGQVAVTSQRPHFTLEGLTPGLDYVIQVVATNALGTSDPVKLDAFTYKMAENRMRDENVDGGGSGSGPVAGAVLVGVVVVVAAVGFLAVVVGRCWWWQRRRRRGPRVGSDRRRGGRGGGGSDSGSHARPSSRRNNSGYAPPDGSGGRMSDDEELHFELRTISLESHRETMTHIGE